MMFIKELFRMSLNEKYSPTILVLILGVAEAHVNSSHPSLARAISSNPLHAAASGGYGGGGCCPPVVDPYTLFALGAGVALATYFLRVLITVTTVGRDRVGSTIINNKGEVCKYIQF